MQQTLNNQPVQDKRFKPINTKYGYSDLQKIGFFCYKSDRSGDWHRSNRLPKIKLLGGYDGVDIFYKDYMVSDDENRIPRGQTEKIKEMIMNAEKILRKKWDLNDEEEI